MGLEDAIHFEFRDEQSIRDRFWTPSRGEVVIDVGCGYGSYTKPALIHGASVFAVDSSWAVLQMLADLTTNCRGELITLHAALYNGGRYPSQLMREIAAAGNDRDHNGIEWTTLDTLVARYDLERLDWLKVDVEGGEAGVLRGGVKALRKFHPNLVIEDHTTIYPWVRRSNSSKRIKALLKSLGYRVLKVPYVGPSTPRSFFVAWVT